MGQSLYLNNGGIFNVADVIFVARSKVVSQGSAFGLYPGEAPITWINLMEYITSDMPILSSNPFYSLKQLATRSTHQEYIDIVEASGSFVWGDIYNGGLYVYRSSSSTYGIVLFAGMGILADDPTREIFYINNFAGQERVSENGMKCFAIVREPQESNRYTMRYGGNYDINGIPATVYSIGEPEYNNPLDDSQITDVKYNMVSPLVAINSLGSDSATYTVNPLGTTPNYIAPKTIAIASFLYEYDVYPADDPLIDNSQPFNERGYNVDDNYIQTGSWWGGDSNIVGNDPNHGSTNTTGGGYGTPSKQSDDIGLPDDNQFSIDATNCGFVTIFNPTAAQMLSFNQWLFASFTEEWWDTLKKILQDPLDFVISAGIIKYKPTVKLANQEIKFNGIGTEVFANTVKQWEKIDLGSISMNEQFKTYLDYSGYSDVKIFLPFCGIQSLDINDVQNSTLHLVYYIDNLTGSCIAHLNVNRADRGQADDSHINSVLYKFTGNAMQTLPLTAKDYATMIGAVMNLATSTVAAVSTGGVGALGLANSVSNSADKLRPSIQRSGNLGSNYGMMDCLTSYLILERPIRSIPAEYGSYVGYPSASTVRIGACKGYTKGRPDTNWASNIHATDREKEEIKELIEGGIYV